MSDIQSLMQKVIAFRDDRDWKQFHTPKDLALSLMLEAGEVAEHFQWRTDAEVEEYLKHHDNEVAEEMADVMKYLLILCNELNVDIVQAVEKKMEQDAAKYPIEKAKGNHTKYNKL